MPMTDDLLLDAWRLRRDPDAFGELVRRHAGMVYATCRRILSNDADAEDITQECFLQLAQARSAVKRSLGGWLHKIATHRSLDHLRRESRRRRREAIASQGRHPQEASDWAELQPHIDQAIDSLPADLRDIIVRHYLEQESFSALGRRLGLSHRAVSYRAEKGVRAIRTHLRSAGISVTAALLTSRMSERGFAAASPSLVAKLGKIAISGFPSPVSQEVPHSSPPVETTMSPRPWLVSLGFLTKAAVIVTVAASFLGVVFFLRRAPEPNGAESPSIVGDVETDAETVPADETNAVAAAPRASGRARPTLSVRVVWAESAAPIAQARVRLIGVDEGVNAEKGAPGVVREGTTNDLGVVELEVREGWSGGRIVVSHELAIESQAAVEMPHDGPLTLALERAYIITGSIVDSTSAVPIAGAVVTPFLSELETRSNKDGVYSLKRDKAGGVTFIASADGYARRKVTVHVTERGRTTRDVPLNPALDVLLVVVDGDGTPVEGVKLVSAMEENEGYAHYDDKESAVTDQNGEARLWRDSTFRRQNPSFSVKKEGYSVASIGDLKQSEDGEWSVRIVLEALTRNRRTIKGHVTDEEGYPIAGALVGYNDGSMSYGGVKKWKEYATTDADGFYRLSFANLKKAFLFVAHCPGWAPDLRRDVTAGTPEEPVVVDFTLKEPHWLSGRVVDEAGQPIEGARVKVIPHGPTYSIAEILPDVPHKVRTDANGQFSLDDLPEEIGRVEFNASGFSSLTRSRVPVDQELSETLYRPGIVRGRVVDAATDEPIAQFLVRITGGTYYSTSRSFAGESFSSAEGVFLLKDLYRSDNPVAFSFAVEAEGYVTGRLEEVFPAPEEEASEHIVKLVRGTVVEGYIVDSQTGEPLSSVHVFLGEPPSDEPVLSERRLQSLPNLQKAVTSESGAFHFVEEKPGTLFFRAPGYRRLNLHPAERNGVTDREGALAIGLEKGVSLSVTYVETDKRASGKGISIKLLLLQSETAYRRWPESDWMEEVRTAGEGRFDWDDLAPGEYFVELILGSEPEGNWTCIRCRVTLSPGVPTRVTIGDALGEIELLGSLFSPEGVAQAQAYVILEPLFDSKYDQFLTPTDGSGKFRLIRLPKGKYAVWATDAFDPQKRTVELEPMELTADSETDLTAWLPRGE